MPPRRLVAMIGAATLVAVGCAGSPAPPQARATPSPVAAPSPSPSPPPFADLQVVTGRPACAASGTFEDIYFPRWSGRPAPAILFIHGGSWISGSRADIQAAGPLLTALRDQGYAVVAIDYRLAPQYRWPAMFDDSRCALDALRAQAPALGLDPGRIAAVGFSAGAQLALLLGLELPASDRLQAVVEVAGPTDLTSSYFSGQTSLGQAVFGVTDASAPVLRQASPVTYVAPGAPPVFILHGTADQTVPYAQAQELAAALQKQGDAVTLVPVPNAGHDLGGAAAAAGARLLSFLAAYFPV